MSTKSGKMNRTELDPAAQSSKLVTRFVRAVVTAQHLKKVNVFLTEIYRSMFSGAESQVIPIRVALLVFLVSLTQVANSQTDSFVTTILAGDVNRDERTDIRDLSQLGEHWDDASSEFEETNETLLADMSTNWLQEVNATLLSAAAINALTPQLAANTSSDTKHLSELERKTYDEGRIAELKQLGIVSNKDIPTSFSAIGHGVTFPVENSPAHIPKAQVFSVPVDANGNTPLVGGNFQSLTAGQFEESGSIPRYSFPIDSETFDFEYVRDFGRELDIRNLDVEVLARYAAFTGNIGLSTSSTNYADRSKNKVFLRILRSYGWYYMPDDAIVANLTEPFKADLDKAKGDRSATPPRLPDPSIDLTKIYGEYYAVAVHLVGSLLIEINFDSATENDQDKLEANLSFSYDAGLNSLDLASSLAILKSKHSNLQAFKVTATAVGGPDKIIIDNKETTVSAKLAEYGTMVSAEANASVGSDTSKSAALLTKIIEAWTLALNPSNAKAVDFVYRPVVERLGTEPKLPWDKGESLRAWYRRYLEAYQQLARAQFILTDGSPFISLDPNEPPSLQDLRIKSDFQYLNAALPFDTDGTFAGYQDIRTYLGTQYLKSLQMFQTLFNKGVDINESTMNNPEYFTGREPGFQLPEFRVPVPGPDQLDCSVTLKSGGNVDNTGSHCNDCNQVVWSFKIENWSRYDIPGRYEPKFYIDETANAYSLFHNPNCANTPRYQFVDKGNGTYELTFSTTGDQRGGPMQCWTSYNSWHNGGYRYVYFGLYDRDHEMVNKAAATETNGAVDTSEVWRKLEDFGQGLTK